MCSGVIRTITKNLLSLTLYVFMCYQNHYQESSFSNTLCVHVLSEPLPRIFFLLHFMCLSVIRTITKNLLSLTLYVFMCYQNHYQESSFSNTLCVHVLSEPLPRIFFLLHFMCSCVSRTITKNLLSLTLYVFMC